MDVLAPHQAEGIAQSRLIRLLISKNIILPRYNEKSNFKKQNSNFLLLGGKFPASVSFLKELFTKKKIRETKHPQKI